jgi:hypothetical protein
LFNRDRKDEIERIVRAAVADATTATTLSAHIAQDTQFHGEIKGAIDKLNSDRQAMHTENLKKFGEQDKKLGKIMQYVWFAMGAATVIEMIGKYLEATGHLPGVGK